MAVAGDGALAPASTGMAGFAQSAAGRNIILMVGAAVAVAVMAGVWMWSQQPDYRVLFSNFSDRDGGAIVASLQQMNIPYKYAEGGGAILVPATQVHDARLKLASQGLPKGGNVGFELMENQKLGVSQFHEQVNFQRALEGELARSIQAIAQVAAARVHLALPKASVFLRDQQKPTASVLINLHPGRSLDQQQVNAVVHLVASSVPELPPKNVSVIDQNGNLLSQNDKPRDTNGLDPSQLKYVQELQQSIVKRIESIITPIVGADNVRAEATADVDFSHTEQAAEIYKPNQEPNSGTVRSQQSSEALNGAQGGPGGVPGALSNQPPAPATAPLTVPASGAAGTTGANIAPGASVQKDVTVNYEVDKTVRYVQQPMGGVKRLSVAVVVNYKREVAKDGKVTMKPLSEAEKTQIADLVKEAMGFNRDRGDTLNVVNSPFAGMDKEKIEPLPIWKQPDTMLQLAKDVGRYLLGIVLLLLLYFKILKPIWARIDASLQPPPPPALEQSVEVDDDIVEIQPRGYEHNLNRAKQLARDDPKLVANVVKSWVGTNE
ncbi:flagellar basal-body MS-ring/collar protein FliF [Janthinobacterium sp. 17J80-10]|uniref:flagellar basal-body MS-ring/collar protein FliF n=1 Tax=Janthinobacterium sp. 17J80-10 TaxID=2497863 RepID=UPI0010056C79|nr:flagellar basal-body MS-ring/collar protein FliF [Janthinobacterium sp. 17J80-10]QAU34366.1 flagellar basal body M-ring protein FliF [Janthinobacterium sp. 17J80-10]